MAIKQDITPHGIEEFSSGNFWVVYGDNHSGKTHFIGTFPKVLVVVFKDKGIETLKKIPGAKYIIWDDTPEALIEFCQVYRDSPFETIAFDTLGVYQDDVMSMIKIAVKKKKMEIQMWGNLGDSFSEILRAMKELSTVKNVIVTFHQQVNSVDGFENQINPIVGPAVYGNMIPKVLYGIANYAIHMYIHDHVDTTTMKSTYYYAAHIGMNPYFWTKFQSANPVPEIVFNPNYTEMMQIKNGTLGA